VRVGPGRGGCGVAAWPSSCDQSRVRAARRMIRTHTSPYRVDSRCGMPMSAVAGRVAGGMGPPGRPTALPDLGTHCRSSALLSSREDQKQKLTAALGALQVVKGIHAHAIEGWGRAWEAGRGACVRRGGASGGAPAKRIERDAREIGALFLRRRKRPAAREQRRERHAPRRRWPRARTPSYPHHAHQSW